MFNIKEPSQNDSRLYHTLPTLGFAQVVAAQTWVYLEPHLRSPRQSEYTHGERLKVLQQLGDFVYTQSLRDDYCGWVLQSALAFSTREPAPATHRTVCIAPITERASLKSPILTSLPPESAVSVAEEREGYGLVLGLGWLDLRHVELVETRTPIHQSALEQIGRSYVWGGRGSMGLDCSALAQWCYLRAGHLIPRDSDLQRLYLKTHHQAVVESALAAGDLLFTKGHVMVVISGTEMVHASGHHMRVVREDLSVARERMRAAQGDGFYWEGYRIQV